MKKEYFAIILLLSMLFASIINMNYLSGITNELTGYVDSAVQNAKAEKWDDAQSSIESAIKRWNDISGYTHVVIKHDKIDDTVEAFYDLLSEIYSEDPSGAAAEGEKLKSILNSISAMEKIRLGSIF